MRIEPLYDRVLVKRKAAESKSASGIIKPTAAQEKSNLCIVVAVGEGHLNRETGQVTPLKVEPGMIVLIGGWAGTTVKIGGVEHLVLQEEEIEGIVFDE